MATKQSTRRQSSAIPEPPKIRAEQDSLVVASARDLIASVIAKADSTAAKVAEESAAAQKRAKAAARKRRSIADIHRRLGQIHEPLRAMHELAEQAIGGGCEDATEAALIAIGHMSMVCMKRMDDCLVDLGDPRIGSADHWLDIDA